MAKFLKNLFSKSPPKSNYTICTKCRHYPEEIFLLANLFTDISPKCYAKVTLEKKLDLVNGEKSDYINGTLENCDEKNAGYCSDYQKKRSFFHF
jgi:hypothetical protein